MDKKRVLASAEDGSQTVHSYQYSGSRRHGDKFRFSWLQRGDASEAPQDLRELSLEDVQDILNGVLSSIQYAIDRATAAGKKFSEVRISSACCVLLGLTGNITSDQMERANDVEEEGVIHTIIPDVTICGRSLRVYVEANSNRGWYASALFDERGQFVAKGQNPVATIGRK